MAISPLDMQVMIPRLSDISNTNQHINDQALNSQKQFSDTMQKEVNKKTTTVNDTNEDEKMKNDADAKKKGKGKYQKQKNQKQNNDRESGEIDPKMYHKIDIKI